MELDRVSNWIVSHWWSVLCQFLIQRIPHMFFVNQMRQFIFIIMLFLDFHLLVLLILVVEVMLVD